jgi:hypothetical protein
MNTFYSPYSVLKKYIQDVQNLEIVNFSLLQQSPNRIVMWVADNDKNLTHFVCVKMSSTQFLIWGYNNNYEQVINTSYDYADVNTPNLRW